MGFASSGEPPPLFHKTTLTTVRLTLCRKLVAESVKFFLSFVSALVNQRADPVCRMTYGDWRLVCSSFLIHGRASPRLLLYYIDYNRPIFPELTQGEAEPCM